MKKVSTLVFCVCLAIGLAIAFTGCSSTTSKSNFTSEQSVIYTPRKGFGLYISSIDDKAINFSNDYDLLLVSQGKHQIRLEFDGKIVLNFIRTGNVTTVETIHYVSTAPIDVMVDFLPGHYYAVVYAGDKSLREKGIPATPETMGYAILDFTNKDIEIIWTNNPTIAKQIIDDNDNTFFWRNLRNQSKKKLCQ